MKEYFFESYDGKRIFTREWIPENPLGIFVLVHGMKEHSLRYQPFAENLKNKGYLVVTFDLRVHGQTDVNHIGKVGEGENSFEDSLKDIAGIIAKYKSDYPTLKVCLFGHSYGSFLCQRFMQRFGHFIDACILCGSMSFNFLKAWSGRFVSFFGKKIKGRDADGNFIIKCTFDRYDKKSNGSFLCVNENEVEKYKEDEFCQPKPSYEFYHSMFRGMSFANLPENVKKIKKDLPILIISGEKDPVGDMGKSVKKLYNLYFFG